MVRDQLRVGQGSRDKGLLVRGRDRVLFVTGLDVRYAYVRAERAPHRRSRILRSRLASASYMAVGEFGSDASVWPEWFREDVKEEAPDA